MAKYLIFNPTTLNRLSKNGSPLMFNTERGAKSSLTAYRKREAVIIERQAARIASGVYGNPIVPQDYIIGTTEDFQKFDYQVEVINLQSGKPVMISKSDVGTCCDPSTERYWTM